MKTMKLFGLVAAVVCLLALAGCGGQSGGEAGYTKEQVQELLDSGAFTDVLDELDCDTAWALYGLEEAGLSREDLTDGVIYRSAGATCEELSLLIFADSGAAKTAQGALESYLQSQIENNRDYRPGEIPKLEDAVLRQEGSTVLLAVSADTPAVEALLGEENLGPWTDLRPRAFLLSLCGQGGRSRSSGFCAGRGWPAVSILRL